jgi:glycosyltransferase involved in cell wall biosynthesis
MQLDNTGPVNDARHPKVSVLMMTYNHAKYIGQAIESVLMQKTSFDYELIIGDDFSSDGAREIIAAYEERHPDRIRVLPTAHHLGAAENWRRVIAARRGAYVATLEGDDYWTSPEKLQVQAELLDQDPAVAVCGHQVTFLYEGQDLPPAIGPDVQDGLYGIEELLRWNFLPTCTAMYRWNLIGTLPDWYFQLKMGDWPMHILFAQHGKIAFLRQPMGVYRVHAKGAWSSRGEVDRLQERICLFQVLLEKLDSKYHHLIRERLFAFHHWLGLEYIGIGNFAEARQTFRQSLAYVRPAERVWEKSTFALKAYTPALFQCLVKLKGAFVN